MIRGSLVFILLMCMISAASSTDTENLYNQAIELQQKSPLDRSNVENALALLSKGLEIDPDNSKLLIAKLSLLFQLQQFAEAKEDAEKLVILHPENPDIRMQLCMLTGKISGLTPEVRQCFAAAAQVYKKHLPTPRKQADPLEMAYAIALIMANDPAGQQAKKDFLENLGNSPDADTYRGAWEDFEQNGLF